MSERKLPGPHERPAEMDLKTLIKLLTPRGLSSLTRAVEHAVRRNHREVTVAHWLLGALDEEASDYSRSLAVLGRDVTAIRNAVDDHFLELLEGSGRPTFNPRLAQLLGDGWRRTSSGDGAARRIRTGVLASLVAEDAARYTHDSFASGMRRAGGFITLSEIPPARRSDFLEEREATATAPTASPVLLPRKVIAHCVAGGQSLIDIARLYAVDLETLARENELTIDATLRDGSTLSVRRLERLPADRKPN